MSCPPDNLPQSAVEAGFDFSREWMRNYATAVFVGDEGVLSKFVFAPSSFVFRRRGHVPDARFASAG